MSTLIQAIKLPKSGQKTPSAIVALYIYEFSSGHRLPNHPTGQCDKYKKQVVWFIGKLCGHQNGWSIGQKWPLLLWWWSWKWLKTTIIQTYSWDALDRGKWEQEKVEKWVHSKRMGYEKGGEWAHCKGECEYSFARCVSSWDQVLEQCLYVTRPVTLCVCSAAVHGLRWLWARWVSVYTQ